MTIRHLRIFIVVFQEMNITRAAEILHMTQPAVTRSIHEIEKYYNICLFERFNHRLYKTEIGQKLYTRALHIVGTFDELEKGLKDWDEEGVLRIGSTITIGNFILPELISEFQNQHPGLKIMAKVYNCNQIHNAVLEDTVDIALVEGEGVSDNIHEELFMEDHLKLIMSKEHSLCNKKEIYVKDIAKYHILAREKGSAARTYLDNIMGAHGVTLSPVLESVSSSAIIRAVEKNIGIAILPERIVEEYIKKDKITFREVVDEKFQRNNYIIWHKQKYLTRSALKFIEKCHEYASSVQIIVE